MFSVSAGIRSCPFPGLSPVPARMGTLCSLARGAWEFEGFALQTGLGPSKPLCPLCPPIVSIAALSARQGSGATIAVAIPEGPHGWGNTASPWC